MSPHHTPISWPSSARQSAFERWLHSAPQQLGIDPFSVAPASADASFRRYLRVKAARGTLIVMDAPPPQEDVRPFVHVAKLITAAGLNAPEVLHADEAQGFLLLTDMGQQLYLDALSEARERADAARVEALMRGALQALVQFQSQVDAASLPPCDEALLRRELALFPEWCVQREFGVSWSAQERATWDRVCALLVGSALAQPQVAVHADWMPRNLMVSPVQGDMPPMPAILDFQDAVRGPISYDLASLLRDAFISWDEAQELDWAVRWWQQARAAGLPVHEDFGEFWRVLEWMGLQRHLKVLGIFCRLKHRDGKPRYSQDLPRFFAYASKVALRYGPLKPLLSLLEPLMAKAGGGTISSGYTF
jgi:N-acetylmuramate 1-kinase